MRYLSICSGIEAATVAWHPLGWQPVAFAEIEAFPSAVLAHHYPGTPNLGDMTRFREWDPALLAEVDLLVGGTPCQAFSVAGLRQSLNDQRGNLTLTLVHLYDHLTALRHAAGRPAPLLVWENVPGVLNTRDNAFGCFLGALAGEDGALRPPGGRWKDAGHVRGPSRTIAWRCLDAQYFSLAQRRERVFLVAGPPGFRAEQVLFEFHGLRRDSPPRREEGEATARGFECGPQGGGFTDLAPTLDTRCKDGPIRNQLGCGVLAFGGNNTTGPIPISPAINANAGAPPAIAFAIQAGAIKENPAIGPDGLGIRQDGCAYCLEARSEVQAVAFNLRGREGGAMPEADPDNLACQRAASGGSSRSYGAHQFAVRRLTPRECERLQGFPDDYTLIPWRSKPAQDCPDGPRYKALGNSMAVPVMRWIGRRIASWFDSTSNPSQ